MRTIDHLGWRERLTGVSAAADTAPGKSTHQDTVTHVRRFPRASITLRQRAVDEAPAGDRLVELD